jgi:N-methylhydantoinase B
LTQAGAGDVIIMDAAGGGGYGEPLERDPEMVEWDVIEGYVSLEKAKEDYGVVINPETMKIDMGATGRLRKSLKKK